MTKQLQKIIFFLIPALCGTMAACVAGPSSQWDLVMPGEIAEHTSAYDGAKHRKINPLFVASISSKWASAGFATGLYSIDDRYFLLIKMPGIIGIESIGINVDGEKFTFQTDELTDFDVDENPLTNFGAESIQTFPIPKGLITRMTQGKRVIMQVRTSEGIVEGNFSTYGCDKSGSACEAFSKFLQQ